MITLKHHQVPDAIADIRLVDYVVHVFPEICSRSAAKKSIKRGEILINNNKAEQGEWVIPGQVISLIDLQNKPPKTFELKLEIVFEDDHLAIIYKPAGISVSGNKYKTIVNALPFNLKISKSEDALKWPLPAHRLDYPTSGLLLIAKTRSAQIKLGKQFENRQIKKVYHAIIVGDIAKKGIINQSIDGQDAVTEYKLLKKEPSLKVNTYFFSPINATNRKNTSAKDSLIGYRSSYYWR